MHIRVPTTYMRQVLPLLKLLFKLNYYPLYELVMRCIHTTHSHKKCGASKGNKEIFLKLLLPPIVLLYVLILRFIPFHSQSRVSSLLRYFFKSTAFNAVNLNSIQFLTFCNPIVSIDYSISFTFYQTFFSIQVHINFSYKYDVHTRNESILRTILGTNLSSIK